MFNTDGTSDWMRNDLPIGDVPTYLAGLAASIEKFEPQTVTRVVCQDKEGIYAEWRPGVGLVWPTPEEDSKFLH
jgi:hypothetical protein